jgi:hypothetical protein
MKFDPMLLPKLLMHTTNFKWAVHLLTLVNKNQENSTKGSESHELQLMQCAFTILV